MWGIVHSDQRKSIQEISVEVGILVGSIQSVCSSQRFEHTLPWFQECQLLNTNMNDSFGTSVIFPGPAIVQIFFLFPQQESVLKGQHFTSAKVVAAKVRRALAEVL
jgi:hypothetical protein